MIIDSKSPPICVRFRTETFPNSKIRYFDVSILVANVLFLVFILIRWFRSRTKLNPSKPLLFSVSCLILTISFVNILRCSLSMIFSNRTLVVHEILLKALWLLIRLTLLSTELSVLLFGLCFGPVPVNRQSWRTMKILFVSFLISSLYITVEAVLEFRGDTRPIQWSTSHYNLYSYGGMKFLLVSSSIFLSMYIIVCFLPCLCRRYEKYLPARRSFYFYCFILALINLVQVIGTILNLTEATIQSVCIVDGTTWIFSIFFAPFVYYQFVRRALSPNTIIPKVIYADYDVNENDERTDDDEDDPMIDPTTKPLIDPITDGQFDQITSSTQIFQTL